MSAFKYAFLALLTSCAAAVAVGATSDAEQPTMSELGMERLRSFAGDWYTLGEDGKPTDELVSSVRVTAGGHAVHETHWPGAEHEMLTVYYIEEGELTLVHYCMLGNQPKMRATSVTDSELAFECVGMSDEKQSHMHAARITSEGANHNKLGWKNFDEGEEAEAIVFEVVRK